MAEQRDVPDWLNAVLSRHQLDLLYLETARQWFLPLAQTLAAYQGRADRPVLVALNGCQGSGKTTVADLLCASLLEEHNLQALALSLDDFYLTRAERLALANTVHPLFATRGVPGTHDMHLLHKTLNQLLDADRQAPVAIPRFDKAIDDRKPYTEWDQVTAPVQVLLLEGWCLGAVAESAEALSVPINALEREEDPAGLWRTYSNEVLQRRFQPLYQQVDQWIMLRAPSFESVFDWRSEQERKLANSLPSGQRSKLMNKEELHLFIQHYERITRNCLKDLPHRVNHLFALDARRKVADYCVRENPLSLDKTD